MVKKENETEFHLEKNKKTKKDLRKRIKSNKRLILYTGIDIIMLTKRLN